MKAFQGLGSPSSMTKSHEKTKMGISLQFEAILDGNLLDFDAFWVLFGAHTAK